MKKLFFAAICLTFTLFACQKSEITTSDSAPIVLAATDTTLFSGSFVNGVHTVTGDVKIVKGADKKNYLVLTNLKSEAGPDIRIYLSEDKTAKVFTQIAFPVVNGNSKTEIPETANLTKQKTVLVWCKQYSVLFGSADLK